ncbi:MAG TPA: AraC family transcriptional regulator [Actinoplanes sp.]|nr:AraC family transcriptional regulator [Actinoplanes sp.]
MRTGLAGRQPCSFAVETSDLDEAREVCGAHLYPRSMRLADRHARLAARFAFLHLDGLVLGDVQYGAALSGEMDEPGSYHVNVPLAGSFTADQAGRPISGDPAHAAVYGPVGDIVLHHSSADCHLLAVKMSRTAVEGALAAVMDASVPGPLRVAGPLRLHRGPGRSFAELIQLLADEIDNPTGLVYQPMVAEPLQEWLLMSLLYAVDHQYSDTIRGRARRDPGHRISRVIDAIHDEPQRAFTVAGMAGIAEMSIRGLHREFVRRTGTSPMRYVRQVRLARAHADLRAGDPARTSVSDVARRWGFGTRRFVAHYRATYETAPIDTLHLPE